VAGACVHGRGDGFSAVTVIVLAVREALLDLAPHLASWAMPRGVVVACAPSRGFYATFFIARELERRRDSAARAAAAAASGDSVRRRGDGDCAAAEGDDATTTCAPRFPFALLVQQPKDRPTVPLLALMLPADATIYYACGWTADAVALADASRRLTVMRLRELLGLK
jgi:hypothetical protein